MQALIKGVEYLLDTSDTKGHEAGIAKPVHIKFCHKDQFGLFIHGLTTEEVIKMLIDRQTHMVNKEGSTENISCLLNLRKAAECLQKRNSHKLKSRQSNDGTNSTPNAAPVQGAGQPG